MFCSLWILGFATLQCDPKELWRRVTLLPKKNVFNVKSSWFQKSTPGQIQVTQEHIKAFLVVILIPKEF